MVQSQDKAFNFIGSQYSFPSNNSYIAVAEIFGSLKHASLMLLAEHIYLKL